ncbi:MAG: helicase associated domain-containing protein, partial [Lachnospiraceae bacterium]|nr:helicase associated domain-containing protein [Lachnospiraceae bacterium]
FWERNYAAAASYYREHRDLNVPAGYLTEDGIRLGTWVYRLRALHAGTAKGTPPTEEQVRRLDAIGMIWTDLHEDKWEKGFQAAAAYQKEHGTLQVPNNYVADNGCKLRVWLQRQRSLLKKGKLSEERIRRLNTISSIWQEDAWESKLALVKAWYREKGTLDIPYDTMVDGVRLRIWLARQKQYLEAGKLTSEQAPLLSELPLDQLSVPQEVKTWKTWLQMYRDAEAYVKEYGSLRNIPHSYRGESGGVLYAWVTRQRVAKKNGGLSEKQIQMLDGIGFVWEPLAEINGCGRKSPESCSRKIG